MMAKTLRKIACIVICLNIISAIFGIAYAINPTYTPVWDVFGIILLVTFFANPFLAYFFDRTVDKMTTRGRKINWVIYGYLLLMILALMGLLGSNFILSAVCADPLTNLGSFFAGIYFSYFGILAAGTIFACFAVKNSQPSLIVESTVPPLPKGPGPRRSVRLLVLFSCLFLFFSGIMFAADILAGATIGVDPAFPPLGLIPAIFGVTAGVFAGFWAFVLLIGTIFLLKITRRYRRPRISYGIGILGIFITGIMFVPLIATPASTPDADASFAAAFGSNWQDRIPASVEGFFMPSRFVLPGYYLGIPPKDCVIIPNISFYNGTTGVDAGITLFFDAYLPPNRGIGLPGGNSTIIRIHGGGWVSTDKGPQNMPQMSRYLAAQGYVV
ncbi:MAG TPA: hypothetical protein VKK79_25125, partial [Candidatus Lokiarchaeia archaeon]|nr:hypothetical protein [Candidatus Lokiarchaeia archaeon]